MTWAHYHRSRREKVFLFPGETAFGTMDPKVREALMDLVESVIEAVERGERPPWRTPWTGYGTHHNGVTNRCFTGFNQYLCWLVATLRGYRSPVWWPLGRARRKRWKLLPDALPAPILMPHDPRRGRNADSDEEHWTAWWYFNQDAFEGPPVVEPPDLNASVGLARVGTLLRGVGLDLECCHTGAWFSPTRDLVGLPPPGSFESLPALAATALHELVHWTGHPSRLARDQRHMGTPEYAFEELVAELGASMLTSVLGVEGARIDDEQHKAYLVSWASDLRENPRRLYEALALADQAQRLLKALVPAAFVGNGQGESFPEFLKEGELWRSPSGALYHEPANRTANDNVVTVLPSSVAAPIEGWALQLHAWREDTLADLPALEISGGPGDGAAAVVCALLGRLTEPDAGAILVEDEGGCRPLDLAELEGKCASQRHAAFDATTFLAFLRKNFMDHGQDDMVAYMDAHPAHVAEVMHRQGRRAWCRLSVLKCEEAQDMAPCFKIQADGSGESATEPIRVTLDGDACSMLLATARYVVGERDLRPYLAVVQRSELSRPTAWLTGHLRNNPKRPARPANESETGDRLARALPFVPVTLQAVQARIDRWLMEGRPAPAMLRLMQQALSATLGRAVDSVVPLDELLGSAEVRTVHRVDALLGFLVQDGTIRRGPRVVECLLRPALRPLPEDSELYQVLEQPTNFGFRRRGGAIEVDAVPPDGEGLSRLLAQRPCELFPFVAPEARP